MSGPSTLDASLEAPHGGGLHPYQRNAVVRVLDAIARGVRRIMLQAATGAGKTLIASAITTECRTQDRRVLFVVPALELVDQTLEKFYREGICDVGVMQASHWMTDSSRPTQIASVQTLMRRELPRADQYDGFPVLTNGVGLLRSMLEEWCQLLEHASHKTGPPRARKVAWLTGRLAAPALEHMADAWQAHAGWRPDVVTVPNQFFGEGVTVSGLLSGRDLIAALNALPSQIEDVVLPRGPFGFDGRTTLDGVSAEEVGAAHPGRVHLASTPGELLTILSNSR